MGELAEKYASWAKKTISAKDSKIVSYVVYSQTEFELLSDALITEFGLTSDQYESAYTERLSLPEFAMRIKMN